jgi:hypothetical protein
MLLGEEEEDSEENEEEIMSPNQGGSTEEAMVSMHATSSNPKLKTMKLKGPGGGEYKAVKSIEDNMSGYIQEE